MSDFADGKYLIVPAGPAAPPPFPVGANLEGGPVSPVIVGGKNNVWTVRKLGNGNYVLTLEQDGTHWLSQDHQNNVVVGIMPLPAEWAIRRHENNSYSIEVPSDKWPTRAWTVGSTNPGTPVRLAIFELPRPDQLWNFNPAPKY